MKDRKGERVRERKRERERQRVRGNVPKIPLDRGSVHSPCRPLPRPHSVVRVFRHSLQAGPWPLSTHSESPANEVDIVFWSISLTLWLVPLRGPHLAVVSGVMERLTVSHPCPAHLINLSLQLEVTITDQKSRQARQRAEAPTVSQKFLTHAFSPASHGRQSSGLQSHRKKAMFAALREP